MTSRPDPRARFAVEVGIAQRAASGEVVPGDAYRVVPFAGGLLVAVADGLGRGPGAAVAARAFCDVAEAGVGLPLLTIAEEAGRRLASTRGAVAALARLDLDTLALDYLGIGNIAARAGGRRPIHPISVPGVVGRRNARRPRCDRFQLEEEELLVIHSDGISGAFELDPLHGLPAANVAAALLEGFGLALDDATCVALRCRRRDEPRGPPP